MNPFLSKAVFFVLETVNPAQSAPSSGVSNPFQQGYAGQINPNGVPPQPVSGASFPTQNFQGAFPSMTAPPITAPPMAPSSTASSEEPRPRRKGLTAAALYATSIPEIPSLMADSSNYPQSNLSNTTTNEASESFQQPDYMANANYNPMNPLGGSVPNPPPQPAAQVAKQEVVEKPPVSKYFQQVVDRPCPKDDRLTLNHLPHPLTQSVLIPYYSGQEAEVGTNNPPCPSTHYVCEDTGNSNPRYIRSSIEQLPDTRSVFKELGIPLAISLTPFPTPDTSEEEIPVTQFQEIVRCKKCLAYVNCFTEFTNNGQQFICNLCKEVNDVPSTYYCPLSATGKRTDVSSRPELSKGIFDIRVGEEFSSRPMQDIYYVFLIDCTQVSLESGLLDVSLAALDYCLNSLMERERVRVGICLYDSLLHYLTIENGVIRDIIMSDIEDPFGALPASVFTYSTFHNEQLLSISSFIRNNYSDYSQSSPYGVSYTAIYAISRSLEGTGGQIIAMIGEASTLGKFKINRTENPRNYGTNEECGYYLPSSSFATYQDMMLYCVTHYITIHFCFFVHEHVHLGEIRQLAENTGGTIYYGYYDNYNKDYILSEYYEFVHNIITRYQAFEGVLKVRASRELTFLKGFGGITQGEDEYYAPVIDNDRCFFLQFDMNKYLYDPKQYVQCALLYLLFCCIGEWRFLHCCTYLDINGNRYLRIFNYKFSVAKLPLYSFRTMDQSVILLGFVRDAINSLPDANVIEIRDILLSTLCKTLGSYRNMCCSDSKPGVLVLNEAIKLLPLYLSCLFKSPLLLVNPADCSSIEKCYPRGDERSFAAYVCTYLNTCSLRGIYDYLYPTLYKLDPNDESWGVEKDGIVQKPMRLFLTSSSFDDSHIFMITGSKGLVLIVGEKTNPDDLEKLFGVRSIEELSPMVVFMEEQENDFSARVYRLIEEYQLRYCPYVVTRVVVHGTPAEVSYLRTLLVEDCVNRDVNYREFICEMHKKISTEYLD